MYEAKDCAQRVCYIAQYLFMNFAVLVIFVLFAGWVSVALNRYCRSSGCHYSKIFSHENI